MNTNAPCYGQRHGHDFPYTGAYCTRCGVNQTELSGGMKKVSSLKSLSEVTLQPRKPLKGIHSEIHWLVNELRTAFGETAKKGKGSFSFYLGFIKRIGTHNAYRLWSEVKQSDARDRKKLFWWKIKQLSTRKDSTPHPKRNDNV